MNPPPSGRPTTVIHIEAQGAGCLDMITHQSRTLPGQLGGAMVFMFIVGDGRKLRAL